MVRRFAPAVQKIVAFNRTPLRMLEYSCNRFERKIGKQRQSPDLVERQRRAQFGRALRTQFRFNDLHSSCSLTRILRSRELP